MRIMKWNTKTSEDDLCKFVFEENIIQTDIVSINTSIDKKGVTIFHIFYFENAKNEKVLSSTNLNKML